MPVLRALLDQDGRSILCDGDGRLKVGEVGREAATTPVMAALDAASCAVSDPVPNGACLVEAGGRAMLLEAGGTPRLLLGLRIVGAGGGAVHLRHGMAGRFLRLTEEGVCADAEEAALASSFRFAAEATRLPDTGPLARIPTDARFDAPGLTALFALGEPGLLPAIEALLPVLTIETVRQAWSDTPEVPERDIFYELVRAESRARLNRFPGYTVDRLGDQVALFGWSIGESSYGFPRIMESGRGKLTIGRYCSMADPWIVLGNHNTATATSYPFVDLWAEWPGTKAGMADHIARDVVIGNDVWIGVEAVILPGAVIGDGAVIGAGCVVRGTIQPYAICVGNPAVTVKYRFDEATRARLLRLRWWDWPAARVDRYLSLLLLPDIGGFLDRAEQEDAARDELNLPATAPESSPPDRSFAASTAR